MWRLRSYRGTYIARSLKGEEIKGQEEKRKGKRKNEVKKEMKRLKRKERWTYHSISYTSQPSQTQSTSRYSPLDYQ